MALDSRNKRASAIYVGRWWRNLFPTPTGVAVMSGLYMLGGAYIGDVPTWIATSPGASGSWVESGSDLSPPPAGYHWEQLTIEGEAVTIDGDRIFILVLGESWTAIGTGTTANWTDIVT